MNDGMERARERRNILEELGAKIPGFRGYLEAELRRAIQLSSPDHVHLAASAYTNLGLLQLWRSRQYTRRQQSAAEAQPPPPTLTHEALASFASAIALDPTYADAYYHTANQLRVFFHYQPQVFLFWLQEHKHKGSRISVVVHTKVDVACSDSPKYARLLAHSSCNC